MSVWACPCGKARQPLRILGNLVGAVRQAASRVGAPRVAPRAPLISTAGRAQPARPTARQAAAVLAKRAGQNTHLAAGALHHLSRVAWVRLVVGLGGGRALAHRRLIPGEQETNGWAVEAWVAAVCLGRAGLTLVATKTPRLQAWAHTGSHEPATHCPETAGTPLTF